MAEKCGWYAEFEGVCCNGISPWRADSCPVDGRIGLCGFDDGTIMNSGARMDVSAMTMTDKELVEALERCATSVSWQDCVRCPHYVPALSADVCCSKLMLEARDRIAAGMTLRKDDSHE